MTECKCKNANYLRGHHPRCPTLKSVASKIENQVLRLVLDADGLKMQCFFILSAGFTVQVKAITDGTNFYALNEPLQLSGGFAGFAFEAMADLTTGLLIVSFHKTLIEVTRRSFTYQAKP